MVQKRRMENWDDYRFFLAVVREGSISGAAQRLRVNHTTVSRRIASLEARLDVRLFERRKTGFTATTEATLLMATAEEIEAGAGKISRLSLSGDTRLSGMLKITAPAMIVHYLLAPVLADFSKDYPEIELHLDSSDDVASLVNREADIAFRVTSAPTETLFGFKLPDSVSGLYSAPKYLEDRALNAANALKCDDLDWIAQDNELSRNSWHNRLFPKGRMACAVNSKPTAIATALCGMGVVELPVRIGNAEKNLVRLKGYEAKIDKGIWILFHRDLRNTARVRAFVSAVRNRDWDGEND